MSLMYSTLVNSIANIMVVQTTQPEFITDLPNILDYGEQRIWRELDLLVSRVTDTTTLTAQQRTFSLPTTIGLFLVVEEINVITPAGSSPSTGTRVPLVQSSKQYIDVVYPSAQVANNVPEFYAILDNQTVLLGPSPDQAYTVEVIGTQRPQSISASNPTTWLSLYLPDLLLAACIVRACAFQKNWSASGDDPAMSVTWEKQYQMLKASAQVEEFRKMGRSQAWTTEAPSPIATPPRV